MNDWSTVQQEAMFQKHCTKLSVADITRDTEGYIGIAEFETREALSEINNRALLYLDIVRLIENMLV